MYSYVFDIQRANFEINQLNQYINVKNEIILPYTIFYIAANQMRQISLFDSFIKKTKSNNNLEASEQKAPIQAQPQQKQSLPSNKKVFFADELTDYNKSPDKINNISEAKPIINEDDQDEILIMKSKIHKKKKMDIEDDEEIDLIKKDTKNQEYAFKPEVNLKVQSNKKPPSQRSSLKAKNTQSDDEGRKENIRCQTAQTIQIEQGVEFTDVTPHWATAQGCRDAQRHRPDHPEYDCTTLYIPPEDFKKFTETMKQYWKIKSENFDKILFFKMGKFYEMFYQDAAICNKHLNLKWSGTKMHVGFPQKTLERYSQTLLQLGYKIVIVEQLQTPTQMKDRLKKQKSQGKSGGKTLNRGVVQVFTKGTSSFLDQNNYLPNYLISVYKHADLIAYALLQMSTNAIMLGVVSSVDDFKTILFQTRPVQLLYDPDNLPFQIVELMRKEWLQMVISKLVNKDNLWHHLNSKNQLDDLFKSGKLDRVRLFQTLDYGIGDDQRTLIYSTLSGMFKYLKSVLKFDYIMSSIKFSFYQKEKAMINMILDSQALQHLQIFQTPLGEKDSLFNRIDRTHTKFGKRLFRRWLMQPLLDPSKIEQRLDAVQDLQEIFTVRKEVSTIFSRLPDMEKIVNRLYHYSVNAIAEKAIYFEDVSKIRLKEFKDIMTQFKRSVYAVELLQEQRDQFKSKRIIKLLTPSQENTQQNDNDDIFYDQDMDGEGQVRGFLPTVLPHLTQFQSYIKWQGDTPQPQKGLCASYDQYQDQLAKIKQKLQEYLLTIKKKTSIPSLSFVHTKERYEIQVSEKLQKSIKNNPQMIFSSKKEGYSRYVTKQIRKIVQEMENIEDQIKAQLGLFVGFFFEQFRKKKQIWERYIAIIAQLDCLISLSEYSFQCDGCRPSFKPFSFEIQAARHPCLSSDVIPNNISLNPRVMILTGPNMGGKSTILRTTCILSILAQIGCYVTAQKYQCDIVDRVFTRIGASDKMEEGKSTFFIQMEETKSLLKHGTPRSLAIMDELGRGTSTFDGMAIAYSVLQYILSTVQCRCIFATHYHSLCSEFEQTKDVALMMMDYLIKQDRIIFLYKLKAGKSGQSFGVNVAKVVNLPKSIIQRAQQKRKQMQILILEKDKWRTFNTALRLCQL